ncbi:hypothetical protein [Marinomonas shanghaiensis]|uniref:hypothetical protein n=1 Tax=Marinomonas shanghaiensis TaxID=2202418 RepID=UPI003A9452DA
MSLIECTECQHKVSDQSDYCLDFGFPIKKEIREKVQKEYLGRITKRIIEKGKRFFLPFLLGVVFIVSPILYLGIVYSKVSDYRTKMYHEIKSTDKPNFIELIEASLYRHSLARLSIKDAPFDPEFSVTLEELITYNDKGYSDRELALISKSASNDNLKYRLDVISTERQVTDLIKRGSTLGMMAQLSILYFYLFLIFAVAAILRSLKI